MESHSKETQQLLADIEIARANLYVYRDSKEREQWSALLDKAQESVVEQPEYSRRLIDRVVEATDNLWKRIFRWRDLQKTLIRYFIAVLLIELIGVATFYFYVDVIEYGFYSSLVFGLLGGTLGVILNLGKDLKVEESNQLGILKLVLRPVIGSVSALVLYSLLQLRIVNVAESLDPEFVLIVLSILAGYSERFVTKALNEYVPTIFETRK